VVEKETKEIQMADTNLNGLRVAILATDYFEQVELTEPKKALEQAGATAKIVAPEPKQGQITGFNHDTKGDTFKVDLPLEQANPADFDAVLLPGGALNADNLRVNPKAQEFMRQIDQAQKPIAVICHGPWLLVSAGFALYVANFASYNRTYGTLAGVIIFLVWLWLTNVAMLFGLEFDAELARQRAIAGGLPADAEPYVRPRDTRSWTDEERDHLEERLEP